MNNQENKQTLLQNNVTGRKHSGFAPTGPPPLPMRLPDDNWNVLLSPFSQPTSHWGRVDLPVNDPVK